LEAAALPLQPFLTRLQQNGRRVLPKYEEKKHFASKSLDGTRNNFQTVPHKTKVSCAEGIKTVAGKVVFSGVNKLSAARRKYSALEKLGLRREHSTNYKNK
jgi:hypothetical protein